MKSLLIAIGTNKALICYRALILFYSVPFWQFSSKLGNLDWNNGINSSAVMLYKLPGMPSNKLPIRMNGIKFFLLCNLKLLTQFLILWAGNLTKT